MPDRQNGSHDSLHNRLADVESRQRDLEIAQARYAQEISHVQQTLDDLKTLMQTSVQLQERQVTQQESLGRAFKAIRANEIRINDLEGRHVDQGRKLDGYINRVRGAMYVTAVGWTVVIGLAGLWFWSHG